MPHGGLAAGHGGYGFFGAPAIGSFSFGAPAAGSFSFGAGVFPPLAVFPIKPPMKKK